MATDAQISANQRNSMRSTGPRSDQGKRQSRLNSLKHGLCSVSVFVESPAAIQERAQHCYEGLKPQNKYQSWLADNVAVLSIRVDRCRDLERQARDKVAFRACASWDQDRALEVKGLAKRLSGHPEEVVEVLRKTPQGCDWLAGRWAMLARAAKLGEGRWSEDQIKLAFDLLGTPREFRPGRRPGEVLDQWGETIEAADDPVTVAHRQIAELLKQKEVVAEHDEVERALAVADMSDAKDPEVKRHRRYEAAIFRQIRWFVEQIKSPTPYTHRSSYLQPEFDLPKPELPSEQPVEPDPRPEPPMVEEILIGVWSPEEPYAPFDLEPHEYPPPGSPRPDYAKIIETRRRARLDKAEAKRQARRKKLELIHSS